jgi:pimeloyl-ACP methyl ester carboxylesterase
VRYGKVAARQQIQILGARRLAASLGLVSGFDAGDARHVHPRDAAAARAIALSARQRRVVVQEMLMMTRHGGSPPSLGSIPLTVLSAAIKPKRLEPAWIQMQAELATLSSDSVQAVVEESGHYLHLDAPDAVVKAIRELVERCRARATGT